MRYRAAYGALALIFILVSIFAIILGVFWFFYGMDNKDSGLILKGIFVLVFGFGIGAVANFFK